MSICLTWFPISGLGKPKLYQNMCCFTRIGITWLRLVIYIKTEPAGEICAGKSLLIPDTLRVKPTPIVKQAD